MYRITIKPDTYTILPEQRNQNPFISTTGVNSKKAERQHQEVSSALQHVATYGVYKNTLVPDLVFCANAGLSLPRLPEPFVITSWMKYKQRKAELDYIEDILDERGINHVQFPGTNSAPFEGQAEAKWFDGGRLLVCGYGYRATKDSIRILRHLLKEIYERHGVEPPRVVSFQLQAPIYYHLDLAMFDYSPTECIIHKGAFLPNDISRLRQELGDRNVHVIDSADPFCLNAIVENNTVITHTLMEEGMKEQLEQITSLPVKQIDVSEFEKSGGAVACLIFTIYDIRHIKRKRSTQTAPSSPH